MNNSKQYGRCVQCRKDLSKDEYGLSIKLLGEDASKVCICCLAEEFGITVDDLLDKIEEYRSGGCILFQ